MTSTNPVQCKCVFNLSKLLFGFKKIDWFYRIRDGRPKLEQSAEKKVKYICRTTATVMNSDALLVLLGAGHSHSTEHLIGRISVLCITSH